METILIVIGLAFSGFWVVDKVTTEPTCNVKTYPEGKEVWCAVGISHLTPEELGDK